MGESLQTLVATEWQELSRHHSWELVGDAHQWVQQVTAELASSTRSDRSIRGALTHAYSAQLYHHLQAQNERAAQELWIACVRVAQQRGIDHDQAAVAAQESVQRVLEHLHAVREPHSLIAYTLQVLRSVLREYGTRGDVSLNKQLETGELVEPASATCIADEVEQQVINQGLLALLRSKLPHTLERVVLIRWVMMGDKPRDIARELGLPLSRTRVAKHRALERLRTDAEFMAFCRSLQDPDHTG